MARMALLIAALGLIAVSAISPASPQAPKLEKLASDIERHYEAGEYSDVLTLAREALPLAERQYGPEHERLFPILRTFGNSYYWLNRYEEAEPLLKRTLAIRESVNGPRDLKVAEAATELANVYYYWTGHAGDAAPLYRRAATIVEAARGPRHAATATAVQDLADTLAYLGQHPEAEPLSNRASYLSRARRISSISPR